jgi:NUMOD4 motif/HNH endonuclease
MEEWKPITSLDGKFHVSSLGNVKNIKSGKVLKQRVNKKGYSQVALKPNGRNGGDICLKVHREVAIAFIPNPEGKPTVNHIDGNKLNNQVSNLEWSTHSENIRHAYANKLKTPLSGEECIFSKLTNEQVEFVRSNTDLSSAEIGRRFGVHRSAIAKIRRGVHWKQK